MSSEYCLKCEDDFIPVTGGCAMPCEEPTGYFYSPYATECLGRTITSVTMAMYLLLPF